MNDTLKVISEIKVMDILIAAIFLFFLLRFIHKMLAAQSRKKSMLTMIHRSFPLVEIFVWIVFLVWMARQIFQTGTAGSLVFLGLVSCFLIWVGGFAARDWIAGIVFNTGNRYKVDDTIRVRDMVGTVTNLGYRCVLLTTAEGGTVEIPYSSLVRERSIEKLSAKRPCASFTFELSGEEISQELMDRIRTISWCAPWSSISQEPQVLLTKMSSGTIGAEVTVFMVDPVCGPEIEAYIRKNLS